MNHQRQDTFTALLLACFFGHENIAKVLIKSGAAVHAVYTIASAQGEVRNNTALIIAAQRNQLSVCKLLVKSGANVNSVSSVGYTPLIAALANRSSDDDDVAKFLLQANADPDPDAVSETTFTSSTTPLVIAASNGMIGVVKDLIRRKVNIDKSDGDGRTAVAA